MSTTQEMQHEEVVSLLVPRFGEGIHEVRIVKLHKQAGDGINQDDILYELETTKSVFPIECEFRGRLSAWLVKESDVVEVGSAVAHITKEPERIQGTEATAASLRPLGIAANNAPTTPCDRRQFVPPRTRAYAKRLGVAEAELAGIASSGRKMLPSDIDAYIKSRGLTGNEDIRLLSEGQRMQIQKMASSRDTLVAATMTAAVSYLHVKERLKQELNNAYGPDESVYVTTVQLIAYYIARAARAFEKFRSAFVDARSYRVSEHLSIGIAVETESQALVTAVVENASALSFREFVEQMNQAVARGRQGIDQALKGPQVMVTYLGGDIVVHGAPLVVTPSVATIAVGAVDELGLATSRLHLSMSFDHRLIGGMEASRFLLELVRSLSDVAVQPHVSAATGKGPSGRAYDRSRQEFVDSLAKFMSGLLGASSEVALSGEALGLLGLDSLKAKILVSFLEDYFGAPFASTFVWQNPTLPKIVEYCVANFELSDSDGLLQSADRELEELLGQIEGDLRASRSSLASDEV
jgi:pyruvate/2-oxoglutarate dehydrogenase complex dihydrolipoamide acyltransferase (E2) component